MPNFSFCIEDVNTTQRLSFSFPELQYSLLEFNSRNNCQHLTNWARWNKRDKVWSCATSLFKWRFSNRRRHCCLSSLIIYPTQLTVHNKHRVLSFSATEVVSHLQKGFRKIWLGSKWNTTFWAENFPRKQRNTWKASPVFPEGMLHGYQFQALAAVFLINGTCLICANGKRHSGSKFTKAPIGIRFCSSFFQTVYSERTALPI